MSKGCVGRRIACVIGPGRTGTSLVSMLLDRLGFDLGRQREELSRPRKFNRLGCWEHPSFMALNGEILRRLGCSDSVPPRLDLPANWPDHRAFVQIKAVALQMVQEEFVQSDAWAWKDPHTTVTLPFWHRLFPDLLHVICLRNPLAMARSYRKTSGYSLKRCLAVNFLYTVHALKHTEGKQRIIVFYDDLVNDWDRECGRLSKFLLGDSATLPTQLDVIDHGLQHERISWEDFMKDLAVPFTLKVLYRAILHAVLVEKAGCPRDEAYKGLGDLAVLTYGEYLRSGPALARAWYRVSEGIPVAYRGSAVYSLANRACELLLQGGVEDVFAVIRRRLARGVA